MNLPEQSIVSYNQKKFGIYGELGEGANSKIRFLETVITWDELDKIKLISNIKGSESWDVRDLFQRDVDTERVANDLVPYLEDPTKIKYFSPITLILLPMGDDRKEIIQEVNFIEPTLTTNAQNGQIEIEYENEGFFKFSIFKYPQPIAEISWNDSRCNLVAIDGQHRLSALKEWENKINSNFSDWKIPVVILNIFKVDKNKQCPKLLEMVRKTFVYINSKAQSINKSRELLLNDESVNAICAQEIIAKAHENDNKELASRDNSLMPLLFFDWQGKIINHQKVKAPASLISVEELHSWLKEYILGEDGTDYQKIELQLNELIPPLDGFDDKKLLTYNDSIRIREQFNKVVLPGLLHFLTNFKPFKEYISACREIENDSMSNDRSGAVQHAFVKLRFGSHNGAKDQLDLINLKYDEITLKFINLKDGHFDFLVRKDLGLRSLIYALAESKMQYEEIKNETIDYLKFSKIFTDSMNKIYETGIFKSYNDLKPAILKTLLEHLCYDAGIINTNYKVENVKDGLGGLLVLSFFALLNKGKKITDNDFEKIWGDYSEVLRKTYERGERKKVKANESAGWNGTLAAFNDHIKKIAQKNAEKKIEKLKEYLFA